MYTCNCKTVSGYQIEYAYDCKEYHYNITCDEKKHKKYSDFITFDIETSRYKKNEEEYESFLYMWQICVQNDVIFGRTWEELIYTLKKIKLCMKKKLVVYVHNLAYEFQFMKTFFKFDSVFSIDEHVVLKAVSDDIEFRCSYKLSNMSLEKFIENTPAHYFIKGQGDLDYKKLRTPSTALSDIENGYCYNDVRGLYHSIMHLLETDTLDSIPLTSTGYVRRECRKACRNKEDRKRFKKSILDIETYEQLKRGFRGGNTASNRYHTNYIIENVNSYDISSSYPYVMMTEEYPIGKFMKASIQDIEELDYYNNKYCTIGDYHFINIRLKNDSIPIPYISHSKCDKISNDCLCYNGRVMNSEYLLTTITNIDFEIINKMYDYDELYVDNFKFSRKEKLSKSLREVILSYYKDKTQLKDIEEQFYFYMKQKNKLNSIYGMFVSALIRELYTYSNDKNTIENVMKTVDDKIAEMDKYNNSRNSFLNYQCGIWVTAYARKRLQELIDIIGIDVVYVDTDSVKFLGNYDIEIERINNAIYENAKSLDVEICAKDKDNVTHYMGIWDKEPSYDEFITMGAKKYAYIQNGKIGMTVSGLNKKLAPIELQKMGGLSEFKNGTVFYDSGRHSVEYVDSKIHYITINNEKILTGSYLNMFDVTYTLGITDTMLNIINSC